MGWKNKERGYSGVRPARLKHVVMYDRNEAKFFLVQQKAVQCGCMSYCERVFKISFALKCASLCCIHTIF